METALENATTTLKIKTKPYYWNPTLQKLRADIRKLHKKTKLQRNSPLRQKILQAKRNHQKQYKKEIKKAKSAENSSHKSNPGENLIK